jgi:hypothetical protein
MAITPKRLYHDAPPNGDTTVFTATERTVVQVVVCTNTTGGVLAASLRIDPTGASPARDLLNSVSIPANDAVRLPGPFVLETGDALVARNHTAALGVTIYIGGFTGA